MSGSGFHHVHVQMADASTSTAEDRETDTVIRKMSESPCQFSNSAFTFPSKDEEKALFTSDPYNDLRDEVSRLYIRT